MPSVADSRLGRLARARQPVLERCELCSEPIGRDHRHLLEPVSRELLCACRACGLLFDRGGRYKLVPERRERLDDGVLGELDWEELRLPVDIAFFLHSSSEGRDMAFYPSPMGATESQLPVELKILATLEPDVEAVLVNRAQGADEHWIVPIDDCFRLVGAIRTHWKGLTGGKQVWLEIASFFEDLERR
jgi:Family of unknown function (DUF5947)